MVDHMLKTRITPKLTNRRITAAIALYGPKEQAVWDQTRARAAEWNVTINSLVITALAEYLERHPEKPHA